MISEVISEAACVYVTNGGVQGNCWEAAAAAVIVSRVGAAELSECPNGTVLLSEKLLFNYASVRPCTH